MFKGAFAQLLVDFGKRYYNFMQTFGFLVQNIRFGTAQLVFCRLEEYSRSHEKTRMKNVFSS